MKDRLATNGGGETREQDERAVAVERFLKIHTCAIDAQKMRSLSA
jgi:hypothetical protein